MSGGGGNRSTRRGWGDYRKWFFESFKFNSSVNPCLADPYREGFMNQEVDMPILRLPGLELTPDRELATPTLVHCLSVRDYQIFVNACTIRHGVGNKRVKMILPSSHPSVLDGLPQSWAHIAFVGIDPRDYYPMTVANNIWYEIDRLRLMKHFRRAFHYPEWHPGSIVPNIMEGERDW